MKEYHTEVLDTWTEQLGGETPKAKLTADQLAKLAQLVALRQQILDKLRTHIRKQFPKHFSKQ